MYLAILKKEIKQFLRSKGNIVMLFVFPVILITTLSVGLKDMMSNMEGIFGKESKTSKVYYSLEDESEYKEGFLAFKKGVEDNINIKFEETSSIDNVIDDVDSHEALAYIDIKKNGFELYSSKNGESTQGKIFRNIFESSLNRYAAYGAIEEYNPEAFKNLIQSKYDDYVEKDSEYKSRDVSSSEYYTFAELALIILYIAPIVGESVYKENQLKTINRIRLSKVNESILICAKVSLGLLIGVAQTLLVYAYSSTVLGVNWGENALKFIILFVALAIFASVVGVIIGLLAKKDTTVNSILQVAIVIICAFGGCYTPLSMIISIPVLSKLVYLSPIYWINVATSSMVLGFESSAYMIALAIPIVISIVGVIAYLAIMRKKVGISND